MQRKLVWSILSLSSAMALIACTASDPNAGVLPAGTTGLSSTTGPAIDPTAGSLTGSSDSSTATGDTSTPECEVDPATGQSVCRCTQLATWGALGTYGAVPGMDGKDAIVAWLNDNSTGDALYVPSKPVIDEVELGKYDVIVIQDISAWTPFTSAEKATFEAWVRAGGGVISLQGYLADPNEMANVNALLSFTGMSYVPNSDTANEADRLAELGVCEDCFGASVPQAGWTSTPIGLNMKQVGAFHGRSVMGGTAVAKQFGAVLGAIGDFDRGHVFLFHDEWVTYNSQWTGEGLVTDCRLQEKSANGQCTMEHPVLQYTIPQFWYNSIKWASGDPACFDIMDMSIIR